MLYFFSHTCVQNMITFYKNTCPTIKTWETPNQVIGECENLCFSLQIFRWKEPALVIFLWKRQDLDHENTNLPTGCSFSCVGWVLVQKSHLKVEVHEKKTDMMVTHQTDMMVTHQTDMMITHQTEMMVTHHTNTFLRLSVQIFACGCTKSCSALLSTQVLVQEYSNTYILGGESSSKVIQLTMYGVFMRTK